MKAAGLVLMLCCAYAGCELDKASAGDPCRRSLECAPGLACVEGECSRNLAPIAEESTVPELGGQAAGAAAIDGAPAADGG